MKKYVNGILKNMTAEEISARQTEENAWNNNAFDRALENLRFERNKLLSHTDFYALSDVTISDEMKTYRQALRDITNGLDTVEKVNEKLKMKDGEFINFPTKPSE